VVVVGVALRASFGGPADPAPSSSALPSPPALLSLPEGLANHIWVTLEPVEGVGYLAGTLDGRARRVLPDGESPLAASDGRVLSVRLGPVASSGFATTSTVILRDVATGEVIVEVERPGMIQTAVMGAKNVHSVRIPFRERGDSGELAVRRGR